MTTDTLRTDLFAIAILAVILLGTRKPVDLSAPRDRVFLTIVRLNLAILAIDSVSIFFYDVPGSGIHAAQSALKAAFFCLNPLPGFLWILYVYDKKLLWRANLYIDQGEEALGGLDWNDAHPWNVPPTGETQVRDKNGVLKPVAEVSPWWNASWGYNDWNRLLTDLSGFSAMKDLHIGDGTQVVRHITASLWFYQAGNKKTYTIESRVSYDHQGWDDPFSFTNKLYNQNQFLNQYYTSNGEKFKKPVNLWKVGIYAGDPENWNISDQDKITRMKECLPDTEKDNIDLTSLIIKWKNYRDNTASRWSQAKPKTYSQYVEASEYTTDASPYSTSTYNPNQIWIENATKAVNNTLTVNGIDYNPYVPGLSDSIMSTYTSANGINAYPPSAISRITAGVDSNGFVQRSYAYYDSPYKVLTTSNTSDIDKYRHDPVYWTGGEIPASAMDWFHDETCAAEITNVGDCTDGDPDPDVYLKVYEKFKYLIPGDVIYRDGHIMLVNTKGEPSGPNSSYLPQDVTLIESVFRLDYDGVFGVVKKRNLQDESVAGKNWRIWREK